LFKNEHLALLNEGMHFRLDSAYWDFQAANDADNTFYHTQSKVKDIELKGHTDSVDQLCWDPKHPETVATAAADKTIRLWDARSK
jgi:WD40 repeat protein